MTANTYLQLHIPIRNLSRFDQFLIIGGDYGIHLLIPNCLLSGGLYSGDDWINRKEIFFYPNDSYVLVTAGDSTNIEVQKQNLVRDVLPIIFLVLESYPNHSLVPHALDIRDLVPKPGSLELDSVEINPALQPTEGQVQSEFVSDLLSVLRPYYTPSRRETNLLANLLREKQHWKATDLSRMVTLANTKLYVDFHTHMSAILGGLLVDFLNLDGEFNNFPLTGKARWKWKVEIIKRLCSPKLLNLIVDFCADYSGSKVDGAHGESRRYWEHSRFDGPEFLTQLDFKQAPPSILKNDILKSKVRFLDANQVKRHRDIVQNITLDIANGKSAEEIEKKVSTYLNPGAFVRLDLKRTTLNPVRLSYYLEAFSSSRVGLKYLHLFQVIESFMVPGHVPEKIQNRNIFNAHLSSLSPSLISKFVKEISAAATGTAFQYLIPSSTSLSDIADSIYNLRCAVVHSKAVSSFINPYSEEEYKLVPPYLELIDQAANTLVRI